MVAKAQALGMANTTEQAWDPQRYDEAGAFVPRLAGDLLELLAPREGERVLDLGAGTGDLTFEIARRGAHVTGLDASGAMVREAKRKYPELEFREGDGQALSFEAELDAVFSNAALHWMPRASDVARGVYRALRPGGRFVAELGGAHCVQTVRDAVAETLAEAGLHGYGLPRWYFPSVTEYAGVLAEAGFFVRSLSWFERPTRLEGPGGFRGWLELFAAPLLDALGERRDEVIGRAEARCRSRLFRGGDWWLDYTRLRVVALRR